MNKYQSAAINLAVGKITLREYMICNKGLDGETMENLIQYAVAAFTTAFESTSDYLDNQSYINLRDLAYHTKIYMNHAGGDLLEIWENSRMCNNSFISWALSKVWGDL